MRTHGVRCLCCCCCCCLCCCCCFLVFLESAVARTFEGRSKSLERDGKSWRLKSHTRLEQNKTNANQSGLSRLDRFAKLSIVNYHPNSLHQNNQQHQQQQQSHIFPNLTRFIVSKCSNNHNNNKLASQYLHQP